MYSALVGWSAKKALPARLRPLAYRAFARAVGANLDETELALAEYPSLGDFFARKLREGARTIEPAEDAIISPCDGVIAARGTATDGALVQAKGRSYRLEELIADEAWAATLANGQYVTIYLSPRDYHRVHAPLGGTLVRYDYIPGALWPVNPKVAARRDALLARNERVVIRLNVGWLGHVAIVMVGAAGVGNMTLAHGPGSASLRAAGERHRVELGKPVERGEELGAFRLGSTVVVIMPPGKAILEDAEVGDAVRFGQRIGGHA
ncbi:MAG TPA: archaetidylserine decarboxylase [Kofleriaceae bacterium]